MNKIPATAAVLSALLVFAVYMTVKGNLFVALDDYAYIVNNPNITRLDWNTVVWAFTSYYEGNWHPLTMLSLALDLKIWGMEPFGFHLTNIIIHCFSVCGSYFLFTALLDPECKIACSRRSIIGGFAAALFWGLHPLRVESVVWASERKDVLCILFIILSLLMYLRYARMRVAGSFDISHRYRAYLASLLFAALALLSKPTAVSLPLILLIIDWYPLKRIIDSRQLTMSIAEKLPFFVLSAVNITATLYAQRIAMINAPDVAPLSRMLVACKALLFYLYKSVLPLELSAFYSHPGNVASSSPVEYTLYVVAVVAITAAAVKLSFSNVKWTALWLFHVITLLPMIGIVQVGGQWAADRYSYLPSLGFALLWGGGVSYLYEKTSDCRSVVLSRTVVAAAASLLLFNTVLTLRQISVWRDTDTLASNVIEKEPHISGAPYLARAIYRSETGRQQLALADIGEAMKIALRKGLTKTYPETAFVQAVILKKLGRFAEALAMVEWGIEKCVDAVPPDAVELRNELARIVAGGNK